MWKPGAVVLGMLPLATGIVLEFHLGNPALHLTRCLSKGCARSWPLEFARSADQVATSDLANKVQQRQAFKSTCMRRAAT